MTAKKVRKKVRKAVRRVFVHPGRKPTVNNLTFEVLI